MARAGQKHFRRASNHDPIKTQYTAISEVTAGNGRDDQSFGKGNDQPYFFRFHGASTETSLHLSLRLRRAPSNTAPITSQYVTPLSPGFLLLVVLTATGISSRYNPTGLWAR